MLFSVLGIGAQGIVGAACPRGGKLRSRRAPIGVDDDERVRAGCREGERQGERRSARVTETYAVDLLANGVADLHTDAGAEAIAPDGVDQVAHGLDADYVRSQRTQTVFIHHARAPPSLGCGRAAVYFSLLGGARPFRRMYSASVAYCSLSWETVPHSRPRRDRLPWPRGSISSALASVREAKALSQLAKASPKAATIAAFPAVSAGTAGAAPPPPLTAPQERNWASVTWFTTRAKVRMSGSGLKL